ncbi:hypothetical protein M0R45_001376 [Rubus argutus]|uniref:Uncharacterized protein n=1 Tax=Rubus argutus TaxID=59490 RepID=A0AAW1VLV4_RUBAR
MSVRARALGEGPEEWIEQSMGSLGWSDGLNWWLIAVEIGGTASGCAGEGLNLMIEMVRWCDGRGHGLEMRMIW